MSPLPWIPRAQLIPYRDGVCGYAGGLQPYSQVACVRCALGVRLELRWGLAGVDADLDAGFLILQPLQPLEVVSRYVSVGEQGGGRSSVFSFETNYTCVCRLCKRRVKCEGLTSRPLAGR